MTDENTPPFKRGQLVVYKSGGAQMTVASCTRQPAGDDAAAGWSVMVEWLQDDGTPHARTLDLDMIELYRSDYERMMEGARLAIAQRGGDPAQLS